MLRTLDFVLIGVMIAAAAFTYRVKHEAEEKLETVHRLEAEIRLEESTIDLLKADWAVLTQPARLQDLIERYASQLDLQTTTPQQIATLNDLPNHPFPKDVPVPTAPPAMARATTPDKPGESGGAGKPQMTVDMVATGSVER